MATLHTSFHPFVRALPVLGLAILVAPLASGCELFVHFDRSRIGASDTGMMDSGAADGGGDAGADGGHDASMDANLPDTNLPDANVDANTNDANTDDTNTNDANTNDAWRPDTGSDAGCTDPALDCPASTDECVVPICSAGTCSTMNLGNSHVLSTGQTPDDCQSVVCNPAGGTQTIADAADHPASTQCDTISCNGSTVMHSYAGTSTACTTSGGTVCDGAGACVECNAPTDCAPTGNECIVRTCSAHTCGTMNLGASHTLSTGQTPGDCQRIVCNGSGGTTSQDDGTDLPVSATLCLVSPACSGTPLAPSFTQAATGTDCTGDAMPPAHVCGDTADVSVAGSCVQCNVDGDCTTPATCQADHTCL